MKSYIIALCAVFVIGSAQAGEVTFYQKETDNWWSVTGGAVTETGQATCYGEASKKDGSFIQIHRSLVNGEVWAIVHNTAWEIEPQNGGDLRWNFFSGGKDSLLGGANLQYAVKNKNTILILQIESKRFTDVLWNSQYFTFVMPGNIENLSFSFERKGGTMLSALAECVKQNERRFKDFKPSLEKVPDSVKEQL